VLRFLGPISKRLLCSQCLKKVTSSFHPRGVFSLFPNCVFFYLMTMALTGSHTNPFSFLVSSFFPPPALPFLSPETPAATVEVSLDLFPMRPPRLLSVTVFSGNPFWECFFPGPFLSHAFPSVRQSIFPTEIFLCSPSPFPLPFFFFFSFRFPFCYPLQTRRGQCALLKTPSLLRRRQRVAFAPAIRWIPPFFRQFPVRASFWPTRPLFFLEDRQLPVCRDQAACCSPFFFFTSLLSAVDVPTGPPLNFDSDHPAFLLLPFPPPFP